MRDGDLRVGDKYTGDSVRLPKAAVRERIQPRFPVWCHNLTWQMKEDTGTTRWRVCAHKWHRQVALDVESQTLHLSPIKGGWYVKYLLLLLSSTKGQGAGRREKSNMNRRRRWLVRSGAPLVLNWLLEYTCFDSRLCELNRRKAEA